MGNANATVIECVDIANSGSGNKNASSSLDTKNSGASIDTSDYGPWQGNDSNNLKLRTALQLSTGQSLTKLTVRMELS